MAILSHEKESVTLLIEKSVNHVRVTEKNFFPGRQHEIPEKKKSKVSNKKEIKDFSLRAQRNCKFKFDSASVGMTTCLCLTYPLELRDVLDGRIIKGHLEAFRIAYQRRFGGEHIWVLEFQKNGNPHYHLVTDCKDDIVVQREFVARTWYRVVGSGLEKHLAAGTSCEVVRSPEGVSSYMASYLGKVDQKMVPENFANVGRFWGGSKGAFKITKDVKYFEPGPEGVAAARRSLRLFKRWRSAKLREVSKHTGIRYKLPKAAGGFLCWFGKKPFEELEKFYPDKAGVPF